MIWFLDFGEIRIGKQIQSWGFVDENSPLDNSCAYDYNFLFEIAILFYSLFLCVR